MTNIALYGFPLEKGSLNILLEWERFLGPKVHLDKGNDVPLKVEQWIMYEHGNDREMA